MTLETKLLGFLGPHGTFTEMAAHKLAANATLFPYASISDVLDAVNEKKVDSGAVPIENSIEGSVNVTLDWLAHEGDLYIIQEIVMPIEHNVLSYSSYLIDKVKHIYSHPQALAQCRQFLRRMYPQALIHPVDSTAEAADFVAQKKDPTMIAIGNSLCGEQYGLNIVETSIQDETENFTRFVEVGKSPKLRLQQEEGLPFKTSILVTLGENKAGALYHVLETFANHSLDLTKIESRPTRKTLGTYHFFIDFLNHYHTQESQAAIQDITALGCSVKWLGSYQSYVL